MRLIDTKDEHKYKRHYSKKTKERRIAVKNEERHLCIGNPMKTIQDLKAPLEMFQDKIFFKYISDCSSFEFYSRGRRINS